MDKLYPNPVQDVLNIEFLKESKYHIVLMNMRGEIIVQTQRLALSHQLQIPSDVPKGNYVLRVIDETVTDLMLSKLP